MAKKKSIQIKYKPKSNKMVGKELYLYLKAYIPNDGRLVELEKQFGN